MVAFGIAFITAAAIALFVARREVAHIQALVVGGRIGGVGCVIAQAATLLVIALLLFLFRNDLR